MYLAPVAHRPCTDEYGLYLALLLAQIYTDFHNFELQYGGIFSMMAMFAQISPLTYLCTQSVLLTLLNLRLCRSIGVPSQKPRKIFLHQRIKVVPIPLSLYISGNNVNYTYCLTLFACDSANWYIKIANTIIAEIYYIC